MCGQGVASGPRAWCPGRRDEIGPVKACEAQMEGYDVLSLDEALPWAMSSATVTAAAMSSPCVTSL
jgi:S-adenosylhomocysteine hydrolase